jgi:D-alanyl-D-alanine carboxypeptidase/D-alanyl-D-alanine-endopeptidase (penicillin-binding protein 4)
MKAHGIRKVDGDILVDQRYFDDQTTPPAFEQQPNEWAAFRAPVSAVALNGNTITLSIRPTTAGQPATAWFDPPGFVDSEGSVKTAWTGATAPSWPTAPAWSPS